MQNWIIESRLRSKLLLFILLFPLLLNAQEKAIVVLHLNDTHSRIEPFPDNDARNPNKAGATRHYAYVEEARKENKHLLLFHSGDFVQGTPYFNLFKGETEMAIANLLKVDAACLGNHEFDNGLDFLAKMIGLAHFPFITTNLDFTGTPLEGLTKEYYIIKRNGLKIGVIGLTVNPEGLVSKANFVGAKYLNPIESANRTAAFLKKKEACDLIICLSHLGYFPDERQVGDITLAKQSRNIDLILGAHTHTFLEKPDRQMNLDGKEVVINQTGAYGIYFGRIDIVLEEVK
jgi:5'-nucleotidase